VAEGINGLIVMMVRSVHSFMIWEDVLTRTCSTFSPLPPFSFASTSSRISHQLDLLPSIPTYTERGADAAIPGQEWDGRGEEPARASGRLKNSRGSKHHHSLAPWDNVVDDDEVEGEPEGGLWREDENLAPVDARGNRPKKKNSADPLNNEQFYPTAGDSGYGGSGSALGRTTTRGSSASKKKSKMGGLLGNRRDRYAAEPSPGTSSSELAQRRDEYQDDFEREINEGFGSEQQPSSRKNERFDNFEQEGPEDAWASSRPAPAVGSARREDPIPAKKPKDDCELFSTSLGSFAN